MKSMIPIGTFRKVYRVTHCDLHGCERDACYIVRVPELFPDWTYLCTEHFTSMDLKLGPGVGQQLVIVPLPKGTF